MDEARTSTSWGEVNVCDLEAQEIFLTFPSRKVLFEARITGSRSELYKINLIKICSQDLFCDLLFF